MQKIPGKFGQYTGKKQETETGCENDQMSDLIDEDFKVAIIYMFKELNETMVKEVKEGVMTMPHQIETINKEIAIIKKNQIEIWS